MHSAMDPKLKLGENEKLGIHAGSGLPKWPIRFFDTTARY